MQNAALKIGSKIREARRQRRLTLKRVSTKSGLSIGFLSQVERDITTPSLSSLVTIARSLDLPVSAFLHRPDLPNAVSRAEGRVAYPVSGTDCAFEQLSTTFPGQLLNAAKLHVPARSHCDPVTVEGEQIVYVLSGTIRYTVDATIFELQPGDAFHFSPEHPYSVSNPTDEPTELLSIGTQPLRRSPAPERRPTTSSRPAPGARRTKPA